MQPIYPITEKNCKSLVGKNVLLFLNNGSELYGIVNRVEKNKLILNDNQQAQTKSTTKNTKPSMAKKAKKKPAKPDTPLQPTNSEQQLSSFGLPLFGGPAPRPTGPVDIQIDYIAAMFSE